MKSNTRDKLLEQAEKLLSRNGFYGTSINDVAAELNITKQGLLHHFPSKEKLYAAVLQNAADQLLAFVKQVKSSSDQPVEQLKQIMAGISEADDRLLRVITLLLRELLDNRERADTVNKWFMRPFLDELVAIVNAGQQEGAFLNLSPLAFVYQLLGATQYFLVSKPTLKRLYSEQEFETLKQQHIVLIDKILDL